MVDTWSYELVLICAIQAAKGMLYLHSQSPPICHRDLKSSNLVVDNHWVVKVTDFGMSRIVPDNTSGEGGDIPRQSLQIGDNIRDSIDHEMTSNLGTTAWCAPEIFTSSNKARYSLPVDVYSFGMVLWEMWERKRPYEHLPSRFDVIDAIKAGNRPEISENCPTGLRSLILRCWQFEPARRPKFSYIVRYLKEELARVQRQRNISGRNFLTDLLSPLTRDNSQQYKSTSPEINSQSYPSESSNTSFSWRYNSNRSLSPVKPVSGVSSTNPLNESLISKQESSETYSSSTSTALPPQPPPPPAVSWRDRYVMRFSGWNAASPDDGLPPSLTNPGNSGSGKNSKKIINGEASYIEDV